MAEVSVSVIGKDLLSASFGAMQTSVAKLSSAVLDLGNRAISPVTIAFGNLFSDVMRNGVNALNNLKGTIESFSFIRLNMEMEMTRSSFTTLLKSGDEANKMLETLRQYANFTPFEFGQLTAATKKMLAFGFSAKEITTDFMGIGTGLLDVVGNAASALGAGQEGIDRITRALGQMRGLARVSAEDMNQLIDVGVQGYQILAEQLGMTVKEVREAMKKGAIDAEIGIKALLQGMMQQYGGGMASFAQTAEGMSSTLNDYIKDIQRSFGEIAYKEYRLLLTEVNRLVSSPAFAKFAQMLGVQFGGAIKRLSDDILKPAIQRMTEFVNRLGATDEAMQAMFNGLSQRIYPFFALFREFGDAVVRVGKILTQFVQEVIGTTKAQQAISWLMRQVAKATEIFYLFSERTSVSGAAMAGFAMKVVDAFEPAALAIVRFTPVLKELGLIVVAVGKEVLQFNSTQSVWRGIVDVYTNLSGTFDQLVPKLRTFRESIPALTQTIITSLAPARDVLSGFIDTIRSSAIFLVTFVKEVAGMRATQSTLASIPERLTQFASALRSVSGAIDDLTTKLPAFFQYIQTLPDTVRATVQSFLTLPSLIDEIKTRLGGMATEALQYLPPMSTIIDEVKTRIIGVAKEAITAATKFTVVGRVMSVIYEVFNRVNNIIQPFTAFLISFAQALLQSIGVATNAGDIFNGLARGVEVLYAAVTSILPSFDQMVTVFSAVVTLVKTGFPIVVDLINKVVSAFVGIVDKVAPALPSVGNIASTLIGAISSIVGDLIQLIPNASQAIERLSGDIFRIMDVILPFKDIIVPALESFALVMGSISVISFAQMATGFAALGQNVGTLRELLHVAVELISTLMNSVLSFSANITPAVATLKQPIIELIGMFGQLAQTSSQELAPFVNALASVIAPLLPSIITLTSELNPLISSFVNLVTTLVTASGPFASEALNTVISWMIQTTSALTGLMNAISSAVSTGDFSELSTMFSTLADTIKTSLSNAASTLLSPENVAYALTEGRVRLMLYIKSTLEEIFGGSISEVTAKIPEWIDGARQYLADLIPELMIGLQNSWTLLSNEFNISGSGIMNAFYAMWDSVSPTISQLPQMIGDVWRDNAPAIMNGLSTAWEFVKQQVRNLWNWLKTDGMQGLDIAIRGMISLFSSGGWNDFMNEADRTITEAMGAIGELAGKMLVTALFDYLPSLVAQLLKFIFQLNMIVTNGMASLISGLIQGMLRILGMDEAADKVKAFFDNQINAVRNTANTVASVLDRFTNFWNSLDVVGTFRNFVRLISDYFANIFPRFLEGLRQLPEMLVNAAAISVKSALTDMLTVIQNAITSITDNVYGLGGVSDMVRNTFQSMRDGINNVGGSMADQISMVSNWASQMNEVEQMTAELLRSQGNIVSYRIQAGNRQILDTANVISTAAEDVNSADMSGFTAKLEEIQVRTNTVLRTTAQTVSATTSSMFVSVGQQISNGIYQGFIDTWPMVADAISSAIGSLDTSLSMTSGGSSVASSASPTTVNNNKNLNMNVTINQTTPTNVVENLRYAQALANARIY